MDSSEGLVNQLGSVRAVANPKEQPFTPRNPPTAFLLPSPDTDTRGLSPRVAEGVSTLAFEPCGPCQQVEGDEKVKEATSYCRYCDEFMCDECKNLHETFRMTQNHSMLRINEPCGPCSKKGRRRPAVWHCTECEEFQCDECRHAHKMFKISSNHHIVRSKDRIMDLMLQGKASRKDVPPNPGSQGSERAQILRVERPNSSSSGLQSPLEAADHYLKPSIPTQDQEIRYSSPGNQYLQQTQSHGRPPSPARNYNQTTEPTSNPRSSQRPYSSPGHLNRSSDTDMLTKRPLSRPKSKLSYEPYSPRFSKILAQFDVKILTDEETPDILGCSFLPDNYLILADNSNKKIKLYDSNYKFLKEKVFPDSPYQVSVFNKGEIAVSFGDKGIVRLSISPDRNDRSINEIGRFRTGFFFCGLDYLKMDRLAVTGGQTDPTFCVFSTLGTELASISNDARGNALFSSPEDVCVDRKKSIAYVSNYDDNTVRALDLNNYYNVIFTYTSTHLTGPQGMDIDGSGNIYVCGSDSHNVHQIAPSGENMKIFPTRKFPMSVAISPNSDKFVVTYSTHATADVFVLS